MYNNKILDDIEQEYYKYDLTEFKVSYLYETIPNYNYLKDIFTFALEVPIINNLLEYDSLEKIIKDETVDTVSTECQAKIEIYGGLVTCNYWEYPITKAVVYFRNIKELKAICKFYDIAIPNVSSKQLSDIKKKEIGVFKKEFGNKPITITYIKLQKLVKHENFTYYNSVNAFRNLYNNATLLYSFANNETYTGIWPKDKMLTFIHDVIENGMQNPIPLLLFKGGYRGILSAKRPFVANFLNYPSVIMAIKE